MSAGGRRSDDALAAYEAELDSPTRVVRFARGEQDCAVAVYLPTEAERQDPELNLSMLGTAGFGDLEICQAISCELGLEITGAPAEADTDALAEALVELASAPLRTGRLFTVWQILTGVALPGFPRFSTAMLVPWHGVDTFDFAAPWDGVSLIRVHPLFPAEVERVESAADPEDGYLELVGLGLEPADPDREPVV